MYIYFDETYHGRKKLQNKNKPKTQQGKQITRNASLSLIQNWKHKDAKQ
jgi:hypothetical protein